MIENGVNPRREVDDTFIDSPFGGIFGDAALAQVVQEIVADPHSLYRPKDLVELTGCTAPTIRDALKTLTDLGLLIKHGDKHPVYSVNTECKRFVALTFLSFAILDDREGSECMDTAIKHYCKTVLGSEVASRAVATVGEYKLVNSQLSTSEPSYLIKGEYGIARSAGT